MSLSLAPGAARTLTAQELEAGGLGLSGRLGDGEGKWQLFVSSNVPLDVMGLMQTRSGHLANLSTTSAGAVLAASYRGRVTGYAGSFAEVEVVLSARGMLRTMHPDSTGHFGFQELRPVRYTIKVRASGYEAPPAHIVRVPSRAAADVFHLERLAARHLRLSLGG